MNQEHFFSQFPLSLESLQTFLLWNKEQTRKTSMSDLELFEVEVALEEIFVNAVSYSGLGKKDLLKEELHISKHSICFIIEDGGKPFNPLEKMPQVDKNQPIEDRDVGGLGIYLVHEIMDEMSYERVDGFNRLTLIKHTRV